MLNRILKLAFSGAIVFAVACLSMPGWCGDVISTKTVQIKMIEDLIATKPNDLSLRVQHAELLGYVQRFDESLAEADLLIKRNPKLRDAYVIKAHALAGLKQYKLALKFLDEAFKLGAPSPKLLLAKGSYLERDGRYAEAVPFLNQVIKADPLEADAYKYRAYCNRELHGPTESCLKDLEMVAKLNPMDIYVKGQIKGLKLAISKQAGKGH